MAMANEMNTDQNPLETESKNRIFRKKFESLIEAIGDTPIVRLKKFAPDLPHRFWAKLEFLNPGGSVKDRLGLALIEGAEKRGELRPGGVIVEATSGNTGLGLAMISAVKGYRCIFVMPDKISEEKRSILRAYGAEVIITPTHVPPDDPQSYISVSKKIARETPHSFYTNQYHNKDNAEIHYQRTGPEIWSQMDGKIDAFVAGAGTGGTLSGVARFLKEKSSSIKIVLADPIGSILFDLYHHGEVRTPPQPYKVEGVGEDMLPDNVQLSLYDDAISISDKESFQMTRELIRNEGLCVGPSSGMALVAAKKFALRYTQPMDILVLFADGGRAYMSKVFNDQWMKESELL